MYNHAINRVLFDFEALTLLTLCLGLGVFALLGSFRKQPAPGIGASYQWPDLLLVWVPLVFFLFNPVFVLFSKASGETVERTFAEKLETQFITFSLFFCVGIITLVMIRWILARSSRQILGLDRLKVEVIALYGVVGAVAGVVICSLFIGNASSGYLTEIFGDMDAQRPVEEMKKIDSNLILLLSILNACVAAPIAEELLFRGYLYGVLKRFSSPLFAALISGALFAVVHVNLGALLPLWVFALILTLSYEMSRCIWVPMLIHALFNGFNIAFLLFQKNKPTEVEVETVGALINLIP